MLRDISISGQYFTDRDNLISYITEFYEKDKQVVQAGNLFERMRDSGMIIKNNALWVIPSYITLFIRKREGRTSYTSENFVRACLQDINVYVYSIKSKIEGENQVSSNDLIEDIFAIEDVYQQLAGASQNNCHKISTEVAAFQLDQTLEVASEKISQFHQLYDNYIMPMLAIVVDSNSELYELSQELIELCDSILNRFLNHTTLTYHVEGLKKSVKVIQERIAEKILQAKNELDLLFEVYREHRRIVNGINYFWEAKQEERIEELEDIYNKFLLTSTRLKFQNSSDRAFRKFINTSIFSEHHKKAAPRLRLQHDLQNLTGHSGIISFMEICNKLKMEKDIPCLLSWLNRSYPLENASFFIEKLFEIEKHFPGKIKILNKTEKFQLKGIRMELQIREWKND